MISEPKSSLVTKKVHEHHDFRQVVGTIAVVSQPCSV
jgi:hypothetical protein